MNLKLCDAKEEDDGKGDDGKEEDSTTEPLLGRDGRSSPGLRNRNGEEESSANYGDKTSSADPDVDTRYSFYNPPTNTAERAWTRHRRRSRRDDWFWRNDLRFRLMRMHTMYPRYVNRNMVHRWGANDYNGGAFQSDTAFTTSAPSYRPPNTGSSRGWGSGGRSGGRSSFSFGGGSSFGGGGGGGSW